MNVFYLVLPYLLILAQAVCPAIIGRRYSKTRSSKSQWTVLLLAGLPIPLLVAGFALFAFLDVLTGRQMQCAADRCAEEYAAFNTLIGGALVLYLFGILSVFVGYWLSKRSFDGHSK
jgi:hypothetical protein